MSRKIVPLDLGLGSEPSREGAANAARHINCFVEEHGEGGKSPYGLYPVPGLTRWDNSAFPGASRGFIERNPGELFAFIGQAIYQLTTAATAIPIASLAGTDRLSLAVNTRSANGAPAKQIAILTQDGRYFILDGTTLTRQDTTTWLGPSIVPNSVTYASGYFAFSVADGRFFTSDLNDGTSINALNFASADSKPDTLLRAYGSSNYLWLFGNETTEIWSVTGALFPFARSQQPIQTGILAPFSLAESSQYLIWVGHRKQVVSCTGGPAQRISEAPLERLIEALTATQQANLYGFTYWHDGHEIYSLQSDLWTWEFDLTRGKWHERVSYGDTRWLANANIYFNKQHLVGSRSSGKIYRIDPQAGTEDGAPLVMSVITPPANAYPGNVTFHEVHIDTIAGKGAATGTDDIVDPQVLLSWSDDSGNTFPIERSLPLGKVGQYRKTVRANKLGMTRKQGRSFKISVSAAVKRGLIQAKTVIEVTK